jgi:two-component system CheB/CheR fusion protein
VSHVHSGSEKISENSLKQLREHVLVARNFDALEFSPGKFATVTANRLAANGLQTVAEYIDFLEVRPAEYSIFFADLFASGQACFDIPWLDKHLDKLLAPLASSVDSFRIWNIGCGRAEAAYMLAVLACEHLGMPTFQRRVKIFATDTDEEKLAAARHASFPCEDLANLPKDIRQKYFIESNGHCTFRNDLRRLLIFGHHNVLEDPPISKMDLVLAPNVLPFYDSEKQHKAIARMKFALRDSRYLLLGPGSKLKTDDDFSVIDEAAGLFMKMAPLPHSDSARNHAPAAINSESIINDAAFDSASISMLVIDNEGLVAMANARARATFGIAGGDFGRPLQDLEVSYRPVELRSLIDQTEADGRAIILRSVARPASQGKPQYFDVHIRRLHDSAGILLGTSVQYEDTTEFQGLKNELIALNNDLQTANEELQSAHEELETTNEELQSTNEELETTNEELQSTNEELQTMNEELQSANSELTTTNVAQRTLTEEMQHTNLFIEAILGSMHAAVIVLTPNLQVRIWNKRAADMFGLRSDEVVGHNLLTLDIGLPLDKLTAPLREFSQKTAPHEALELAAINRRGKNIVCNIRMSKLGQGAAGTILIIDEVSITGNGGNE